jgi:hypothetical protein
MSNHKRKEMLIKGMKKMKQDLWLNVVTGKSSTLKQLSSYIKNNHSVNFRN